MLSPREELEIGYTIATQLKDLILSGKVSVSEIRSTLRDVVQEFGVGHTDDFFINKVVRMYRR